MRIVFSLYNVICLIRFNAAILQRKTETTSNDNKKPLLMGKKEGKNNIKIMKKIRLYFFSMPQHQKVMQR